MHDEKQTKQGIDDEMRPQYKSTVKRSMPIQQQIKSQEKKVGRKTYKIDSSEQVDWFIRKYVEPEY